MNYFTGAQLPVTSFLARNYAVCDDWWSSVPTQMFANRVFALWAAPGIGVEKNGDGTAYSRVDDLQYVRASSRWPLPSILSRLDDVLSKRKAPATRRRPTGSSTFTTTPSA
jgi:phospholipase C